MPEGERMPRDVGELRANRSGVGIGRDHDGVKIGVADLGLPPPGDVPVQRRLKPSYPLVTSEYAEKRIVGIGLARVVLIRTEPCGTKRQARMGEIPFDAGFDGAVLLRRKAGCSGAERER